MFVQGRLLAPDWGNYPSLPPPTQSPFCPPTVKQTLYSSPLLRIVQKKMLTEHLYVNSLERLFENTGVVLCLNRVSISIEKAKRDTAGWETGREKAENSLHSPQCCYSISSWLPASPLSSEISQKQQQTLFSVLARGIVTSPKGQLLFPLCSVSCSSGHMLCEGERPVDLFSLRCALSIKFWALECKLNSAPSY